MTSELLHARLDRLEADNARLRRLLNLEGVGAELRHQTRNILAVLRTIVRRSAETSDSVEDYAAHLEGRLDVIVRTQNAILRHRDGVDFHSLIAEELRVVGAQEGTRAQLSGPRLALRPKAAEILALAFHELATNAVKFGALAGADGRIAVLWHANARDADEPCLTLVWHETGVASSGGSPTRRGFGREVIERVLQYELKTETEFELLPAGLRCKIRLPFPSSVGALLATASDNGETGGSRALEHHRFRLNRFAILNR